MPHPEIDNRTVFSVEPLLTLDPNGRPQFGVIIKGTLGFDARGRVFLAPSAPVSFAGELGGDQPAPWYRIEPETAYYKPATDFVLLGCARSPGNNMTSFDVGVRCGDLVQRATVFGDRFWVRDAAGRVQMTAPRPVESLPLSYEYAFGGWDRGDPDELKHVFDERNPIGRGFGTPLRSAGDRAPLPNIESTSERIRQYGQTVAPVGFGFVAPSWQPRARFAGTYDEAWSKTRKPLLPSDFDPRFFNAASPGLIAPGYLLGNERIDIVNASAVSRLTLQLPGFGPVRVLLDVRGASPRRKEAPLDTVVVDTDAMKINLLWRACFPVDGGMTRVSAAVVDCEHPAARKRVADA